MSSGMGPWKKRSKSFVTERGAIRRVPGFFPGWDPLWRSFRVGGNALVQGARNRFFFSCAFTSFRSSLKCAFQCAN